MSNHTCRFCEKETPGIMCADDATHYVHMPHHPDHKFYVCAEHVEHYRDPDGVRGRKRFDGRYIIQPINVKG